MAELETVEEHVNKFLGYIKKKTTDEEYEIVRNDVFEDLD